MTLGADDPGRLQGSRRAVLNIDRTWNAQLVGNKSATITQFSKDRACAHIARTERAPIPSQLLGRRWARLQAILGGST